MRLLQIFILILFITVLSTTGFTDTFKPPPMMVSGEIIEISKPDQTIQVGNINYKVQLVDLITLEGIRVRAGFADLEEGLRVIVVQGEEIEPSIWKAALVTIPEGQEVVDDKVGTNIKSSSSSVKSVSKPLDLDNSYETPAADGSEPSLENGVWKN